MARNPPFPARPTDEDRAARQNVTRRLKRQRAAMTPHELRTNIATRAVMQARQNWSGPRPDWYNNITGPAYKQVWASVEQYILDCEAYAPTKADMPARIDLYDEFLSAFPDNVAIDMLETSLYMDEVQFGVIAEDANQHRGAEDEEVQPAEPISSSIRVCVLLPYIAAYINQEGERALVFDDYVLWFNKVTRQLPQDRWNSIWRGSGLYSDSDIQWNLFKFAQRLQHIYTHLCWPVITDRELSNSKVLPIFGVTVFNMYVRMMADTCTAISERNIWLAAQQPVPRTEAVLQNYEGGLLNWWGNVACPSWEEMIPFRESTLLNGGSKP